MLKYYTLIDSNRCLRLDLSSVTKQTAQHLTQKHNWSAYIILNCCILKSQKDLMEKICKNNDVPSDPGYSSVPGFPYNIYFL